VKKVDLKKKQVTSKKKADSKDITAGNGDKTADNSVDPYTPFPDSTNPETGEIGGPVGPEPTRYGDWERKGRVSDF